MGYRSTVAYTIRFTPIYLTPETTDTQATKEAKESFYTFLAEAKVKCTGAFGDDFGVKVDESNMALNFVVYDVKWYEGYEQVKVHEELIQLSKDWVDMENKNIGGIFMRIGEELDDLTEEDWGEADWDWIQMSRQIHCDWLE